MTVSLASDMEKLSLTAKELDSGFIQTRLADEENGIFENERPRKEHHRGAEDILKELEEEFLEPPHEFSPRWLNQLQK